MANEAKGRLTELRGSFQNPHPEGAEPRRARAGEWARGLPEEDAEALVCNGKAVRWVPGEDWVEVRE